MFRGILKVVLLLAKNRERTSEVRSSVEGAVGSSLPFPVSRSATSFPEIPTCEGIHCKHTVPPLPRVKTECADSRVGYVLEGYLAPTYPGC
ncbi:hypothetical protein NPIL_563621 [Nephila pilipes]|uniref:Uncharacterized protein n=1 Tax=Nephila pilipes TaxID=299642 RepID=A0A8X6N7U5_NEPPI|nr:hypothetical protein NPIL_563621 [Nephila pilipes]